jgi:hypothetical protein
MFPFSIEGTLKVADDELSAALDRVEGALGSARAKVVKRWPSSLIFEGDGWGSSPRKVVSLLDRCEIAVGPGRIHYQCSIRAIFLQVMMIAVFFSLMMGVVRAPLTQHIAVPLFFSLLIFVASFFMHRVRLRRFLARAIRNGNRRQRS